MSTNEPPSVYSHLAAGEVLITLTGPSQSGKSALMYTFDEHIPDRDFHSRLTRLLNTSCLNPIQTSIHGHKASICETPSSQPYSRFRHLYYPTLTPRNPSTLVVCYSLARVPAHINAIREAFAPEIRSHSPGVPLVLIGTMSDRTPPGGTRGLPPLASSLALELHASLHMLCSVRDGSGRDAIRSAVQLAHRGARRCSVM